MILEILCFFLGIHLAMMLIAACYSIIDLWYRLSEYIAGILIRILAIAGVISLCIWGFEEPLRDAFVAGQLFFVAFHIAIYWFGRLVLVFLAHRPKIKN